jgi:hypothetical protein
VLVFRANVSVDKERHLTALLERLQVVDLLFRLSCDMRLISVSQYAAAIKLAGSAGKQANGWRRSSSPAS